MTVVTVTGLGEEGKEEETNAFVLLRMNEKSHEEISKMIL